MWEACPRLTPVTRVGGTFVGGSVLTLLHPRHGQQREWAHRPPSPANFVFILITDGFSGSSPPGRVPWCDLIPSLAFTQQPQGGGSRQEPHPPCGSPASWGSSRARPLPPPAPDLHTWRGGAGTGPCGSHPCPSLLLQNRPEFGTAPLQDPLQHLCWALLQGCALCPGAPSPPVGCLRCRTPLVTARSMAGEAGMGLPVRPWTGQQVLVCQFCPCVCLCLFLV